MRIFRQSPKTLVSALSLVPFRRPPLGTLGTAALLAFGLSPAHAATLNVPAQYPTIQAGIDAAQAGDTVLVADGIYTGAGNVDLDFGGKNITVKSVNGPAVTVIDCQGTQSSPHRGFNLHGGETAAVIDGFTVENGFAPLYQEASGNYDSRGGGIEAFSTTGTTIENCIVSSNTLPFSSYHADGAGIDVGDGATITDCTVTGNIISPGVILAGAAGIEAGTRATIIGCTVSANFSAYASVTSSTETEGAVGGIKLSGGTIAGCTVSDNRAGDNGAAGGVYALNSNITGCTISGNATTREQGLSFDSVGGVIAQNSTLTNCTISNNTATNYDGVGGVDAENSVITGCTVSGNASTGASLIALSGGISPAHGGMSVAGCTVVNTVISGNSTNFGAGGVGVENFGNGGSTLTNCTLTGNITYLGSGGAVQDKAGDSSLVNCICYNDSAGQGGEIWSAGGGTGAALRVTCCDIQGGYSGTGNISAVPLFVSGAAGDFHLQPTSFCRGAGTAVGAPATDKDGSTRPSTPSIGAYDVPGRAWTAVGISTGADGFTRILWDQDNGKATVWKVSASGRLVTQQQFGPYQGWTARAIATGKDNQTHLLWTNTDGTASFYLLDANNVFLSQQQYGPYSGWQVQGLTVSPNNTVRALWDRYDGTATIWTLDTNNVFAGTQTQYGPFSAGGSAVWTAKVVTVSPDGTERLLWTDGSGKAAFWRLSGESRFLDQQQYGPYPNWTVSGIASATDDTARVTWTDNYLDLALWTIDGDNVYTGQYQYGPYPGWSYRAISVGSDGNARLLWDNVTGQAALWSLTPGGSFASEYLYGPY